MIIVYNYNNTDPMISFKSQIAVKVLGYFFLNPESRRYINELADLLAVDPGNLSRKLIELEKEKIMASDRRGNQRYYFLNKDYPLLREVKKMFDVDFGLPRIIEKKLGKLKGLDHAYIYGSWAKNAMDKESDIDLLLVGSHSSLEAKRRLLPLQKEIGREISVVDMGQKEFKQAMVEGDPFIKNIFSDKIIELATK
ncbi:MAG: nucleotidyltransferase domain-containing protein [Candidatus Nealsonbacteria bacterium DGGOD1a]|nr:MAG: nucleotidyltransferase domain-containing protein [Candidatus Nealsonbacteria bacterium DGGOD1a]